MFRLVESGLSTANSRLREGWKHLRIELLLTRKPL